MTTGFLISLIVITIVLLFFPVYDSILEFISGTYENKYNKYIIYEHYDENNPLVKWYSAEVSNYKLFWLIPIYTNFYSLFSDKDLIYFNSKEKLLKELNEKFEYEEKKRKKKSKIITRKISSYDTGR